jgi:hypothetical protein
MSSGFGAGNAAAGNAKGDSRQQLELSVAAGMATAELECKGRVS